jgi:hypothetical protein
MSGESVELLFFGGLLLGTFFVEVVSAGIPETLELFGR